MATHYSIIITDDDKEDQEFLKEAIERCRANCEIKSAYNGKELMNMLLDKNLKLPDLIILDLNMPLMDGYEVLKKVRKHAGLKHLPVYVLTTSEHEYDRIKAVAYGANGFYSKPMQTSGLIKIVNEIFSKIQFLVLSK